MINENFVNKDHQMQNFGTISSWHNVTWSSMRQLKKEKKVNMSLESITYLKRYTREKNKQKSCFIYTSTTNCCWKMMNQDFVYYHHQKTELLLLSCQTFFCLMNVHVTSLNLNNCWQFSSSKAVLSESSHLLYLNYIMSSVMQKGEKRKNKKKYTLISMQSILSTHNTAFYFNGNT